MVEVTDADREAAASGYYAWCSGNPVIPNRILGGNADDHSMVQAFARHRIAAFANGFSAALQGAEALTWGIEDDSFLYEIVSEALQEVISELQAMERNWTGRATVEHRIAAEQRGKLEGARLALEEVSSLTLMLSEKCACEIKQDAFRAWAGIIAALDPAKIVGEG